MKRTPRSFPTMRGKIRQCLQSSWHCDTHINFQSSIMINDFIIIWKTARPSKNGIQLQHSCLPDRIKQVLNVAKYGLWYLLKGQDFVQMVAVPRQQKQNEDEVHKAKEIRATKTKLDLGKNIIFFTYIEGNTKESQERNVAKGLCTSGRSYNTALRKYYKRAA